MQLRCKTFEDELINPALPLFPIAGKEGENYFY
jgi:hypothetical protein